MSIRAVATGCLAGILMFAWHAAAHMSPLGDIGIDAVPRELLITETLNSGAGGAGGLYVFPASPEASADVPSGFMVFYPDNLLAEGMERKIVLEIVKDIAQALLVTLLIVMARVEGFATRLGFATAIGLLAAFTVHLSHAIWYHFPIVYVLADGMIALIGYVIAGTAIALLLPRTAQRAGTKDNA